MRVSTVYEELLVCSRGAGFDDPENGEGSERLAEARASLASDRLEERSFRGLADPGRGKISVERVSGALWTGTRRSYPPFSRRVR